MRCCITLFFQIFFVFNLYAQVGDIKYNLVQIPPSPDQASLGKYGEFPVDLSTGVPSISIPLIEINEGGISLPITLNYHAGGIKVSEEASWVGLGWSLSAGGSISRTVRGLPDDCHAGFLNNCMKVPSDGYIEYCLSVPTKQTAMLSFLQDNNENKTDYEPDLFQFNTVNDNGSFMFNNIAKISTIPYKDVIINPYFDNSHLCGFELLDPNGILYFFGDTIYENNNYIETTLTTSGGPHIPEYVSSWLIHKIINPYTDQEIEFIYTSYNIHSYTNSESALYQRNALYNPNYSLISNNNNPIHTMTYAKFLSEISINDNIIQFYSSLRSDVDGKKLDSIKLNNTTYIFETDYFKVLANSTDQKELRLKLNSIKEVSNINHQDPKIYTFNYYCNPDSSINLPKKDSYAIDHWGYFNNKGNNTAIPTITYGTQTFIGANRSPDPLF